MFYVITRLIRSKWITVYSLKTNIYIGKFKPEMKSGLKHTPLFVFLDCFRHYIEYFLGNNLKNMGMFVPVLSLLTLGQGFSDKTRKPNIIRQGEGF